MVLTTYVADGRLSFKAINARVMVIPVAVGSTMQSFTFENPAIRTEKAF
eukprot:SAG31_NODE_1613_length_7743_cov_5.584903_6_plen_49_part_00